MKSFFLIFQSYYQLKNEMRVISKYAALLKETLKKTYVEKKLYKPNLASEL